MGLNIKKTKRSCSCIQYTISLTINSDVIKRVSSTKLLCCRLTDTLSWDVRIHEWNSHKSKPTPLSTKGAERSWEELRGTGVSPPEGPSSHLHISIVGSHMEYACQVWSPTLTKEHYTILESIPRHAMRILVTTISYKVAQQEHPPPPPTLYRQHGWSIALLVY